MAHEHSESDIPEGYEVGDWEFDPEIDPDWDDPTIPRRRVHISEYEELADAVVRRASIAYCVIEDLRALIEAVQRHPDALLAKLGKEDEEGITRTAGIFDKEGNKVEAEATELRFRGCLINTADLSDLDIGCRIECESRFGGVAWFDQARFGGQASFDYARFDDQAWFENARFYAPASFNCTHFSGLAVFGNILFYENASFENARFGDKASFDLTRFGAEAWFSKSRYSGQASFCRVNFGREVWFGDARFDCMAWFLHTEFERNAGFGGFRLDTGKSLIFHGCRFHRSLTMKYCEDNRDPRILGTVLFKESTLDERLTMDHAVLGPQGRLSFHRFLARGGATIEIPKELIAPDRIERLAQDLLPATPWREMKRFGTRMLRWFGLRNPDPVMKGEDSRDIKELESAADDYELLAANFARQPATDWEEDLCRWRAHEIRRRVAMRKVWQRFVDFMQDDGVSGNPARHSTSFVRWGWEYFSLIGRIVWEMAHFIVKLVWNVVMRWFVQRNCVGYLLDPTRIAATGGFLLIVFAVIYAIFVSHVTINIPDTDLIIPYEQGWIERLKFGAYFSLMTFVTLGYGDYSPAHWFKLVTGTEALLGVTLLALFTVAWGRKLVR